MNEELSEILSDQTDGENPALSSITSGTRVSPPATPSKLSGHNMLKSPEL